MKKYLYIVLLVTLSTGSCSKFLETTPKDFVAPENYFNTEEDLNHALMGVYNRLIGNFGRMYQRGMWSYFAISDEFYYTSPTSNNIKAMDFDAANIDVQRLWEVLYQGIERANQLLVNVGKPVMDERKRDNIKGQALFLRAYFHFVLVNFFGEVPLKLNPTLSPDEPPLPGSPIDEIYLQVVKDMQEAENLVNDIELNPTNELVSKTAVQAILARVFLKMAGAPLNDEKRYEDALIYANKVISSEKHSLNPSYSEIFINHSKDINEPEECIWEIGMYGNHQGPEQIAGSVGIDNGILSRDNDIGYAPGTIRIHKRIYDLFEESDLRRDWAIAPFQYVTTNGVTAPSMYNSNQIYERNIGKWRREYETYLPKHRTYNATNFPVIRYADVLLMKAEAENKISGPTVGALDAINMVRRRGYGLPVDIENAAVDIAVGISEVDLSDAIEHERARELCFEGMRKHDLIRWNKYVDYMQSLIPFVEATAPNNRKAGALAAAKNISERNLLLPIPFSELNNNPPPNLNQNPGWQ